MTQNSQKTYSISNWSKANDWEDRKSIFSDDGVRVPFPSELKVSDEERALFDTTKNQVKARAIRLTAIIAALTICSSISFNDPTINLMKYGIAAIACVLVFFFTRSKGSSGDIKQNYIDHCVKPLVSQYDEDINVSSTVDVFPTYGTCSEFSSSKISDVIEKNAKEKGFNVSDIEKAQGFINGLQKIENLADSFEGNVRSGVYHESLGNFLYAHQVLPQFKSGFSVSLTMENLTKNKEGFLLVNGIGYNISTNTSSAISLAMDNPKKKQIVFDGTVLAVRMKHIPRCDVSLFTSKRHFGKEFSSGYYMPRETINTENEEFNQNFEVVASEESQAFFILSPLVMERLLALKEKYGQFGVYIHDDYIIFGMNWKKQPLSMPDKISASKKMSIEQSFEDMKTLLSDIYEIKDAIDLNFKN